MILTYQLDFLPHPNYAEILKSTDLDLAPNPQSRILGLYKPSPPIALALRVAHHADYKITRV